MAIVSFRLSTCIWRNAQHYKKLIFLFETTFKFKRYSHAHLKPKPNTSSYVQKAIYTNFEIKAFGMQILFYFVLKWNNLYAKLYFHYPLSLYCMYFARSKLFTLFSMIIIKQNISNEKNWRLGSSFFMHINIFSCFWMTVKKHFTYLICTHFEKYKVLYCEIFATLFSYEDKDISRFLNLQ